MTGEPSAPITARVKLGEHEYEVYPQRHAYLTNRLGKAIEQIEGVSGSDVERGTVESFVGALGDQAYTFLKVFIPKLMPIYEFRGFPTQEAYEAGDYDEEYDRSPSFPEIVEAFQTALRVNRLDKLGMLGKVVDTKLLKAYASKAMADYLDSRSSSAPATDGTSTTSGTTPPMSMGNGDSPSPDSPHSLTTASDE